MAMKKIKPQYGKVIPPAVKTNETDAADLPTESGSKNMVSSDKVQTEFAPASTSETAAPGRKPAAPKSEKSTATKTNGVSKITSEPNPFLQTREIFGKARLTKVGYRVRTDYVEILDIIKKIKKSGYTLEAVLDDALTFYFENSEDGKEALRKAEIFYS